jgi:acetylglutamate kinase
MTQIDYTETKHWLRAARTLTEALPYMRRYSGKTFVVKYGGNAMVNKELAGVFAQDIVLLRQVGINPIVVHGGGPQINQMLDRLQIKSHFIDGLRVTDAPTMEVVEMVLAGSTNKHIVSAINAAGGKAVGLSGRDGNLLVATKQVLRKNGQEIDLGFVGDPKTVDPHVLKTLAQGGMIPVIAPVSAGEGGETYNINADTAAGAIAAAVGASRLLLLTDVAGVLDKEGKLLENLTVAQVKTLMSDGTISGGMIPKLETCIEAVEGGVEGAVIIDGRVPHSLLLEIFTERGVGTFVSRG